jgi:hypothetical protein
MARPNIASPDRTGAGSPLWGCFATDPARPYPFTPCAPTGCKRGPSGVLREAKPLGSFLLARKVLD